VKIQTLICAPELGETIQEFAFKISKLANSHKAYVCGRFNDIDVSAEPLKSPATIISEYLGAMRNAKKERSRAQI